MVFLGTFLLRILSLAGPPISTPTASNYEFTHKRIIRLWCGEVYVDPTHALSSLELSHMTILCSSESQKYGLSVSLKQKPEPLIQITCFFCNYKSSSQVLWRTPL